MTEEEDPKESHGRASNEQSKKITVNESINCDVKVEKLFLNHNLPLVFSKNGKFYVNELCK